MIPVHKVPFGEEEKKAINDCIDSGWVAPGVRSRQFEEKFAEYVGAKYAVFVDSCTGAMFLSTQYLKHTNRLAGPITVPSLTFTSTAEVLIQSGFEVRFGDVDPETYCLKDVTENSLPVHLYGYRAADGALIYDSAHRIGKNDVTGSDALWCYSFYATKNISTVSGGMIATNNKGAYDWLSRARDHGLSADTKVRYSGVYKQYDVEFVGWRTKGDDVRAAIGLEQLKKLPRINERRDEIVAIYNKAFGRNWTGNHVYGVFVNDQKTFVNYLYEHGIQTTVHFRPLHSMTGYQPYYHGESLPVTEDVGSHEVTIPLFPQLTNDEIQYIIATTQKSGMLLNS